MGLKLWKRCAALLFLITALLFLVNCGSKLPPLEPLITITPASATVQADIGTQQFVANVTRAVTPAVTWLVNNIPGGNATVGTIDTNGLYRAPKDQPTPSLVTITAVSQADTRSSANASVTVTPPVAVAVSPTTATVHAGKTQQFTATVTNASNTAVTWSVNGITGGSPAVGTINSSGLYTAPSSVSGNPLVTVTATSVLDPNKSASATVTLAGGITVVVSPKTVTLGPGGTQTFTATVTGTTNTAVTWSVNGVVGGDSTVGTITANGVYTAPANINGLSSVTVTATSQVDTTASDSAQVNFKASAESFTLTCPSSIAPMAKATTQTVNCTITTSPGSTATITVTATTVSPNVGLTLTPKTFTAGGTAALQISTASISLATTTPITVTATSTDPNNPPQSATLQLTITGWVGHVRTAAGIPGGPGFQDGSGTQDELLPYAITTDGKGTFYFVDGAGYALRSFVLASGTVTTLTGSPFTFPFQDPEGVVFDASRNTLYIADAKGDQIVKYVLGSSGVVLLAGAGTPGFADGVGRAAMFDHPRGLALTPDASTLYVADSNNDVIRAINLATAAVTTVAGKAGVASSTDGTGTGATFCQPWAVAIDPTGSNLYTTDTCSFTIRRITLPALVVSTIAGNGFFGTADGPARSASFTFLHHLAVDPHNNGTSLLYINDDNRIRALTLGSSPTVFTVAGQVGSGAADGSGTTATFAGPRDLVPLADFAGANTTTLIVADTDNGLLRRVDISNPLTATSSTNVNATVTTVAGQTPHRGFVNGVGTGVGYTGVSVALFNAPSEVITDGKVAYVSDSGNSAIRKVDMGTTDVTTLAGGTLGSSDGTGSSASFNNPEGLALVSSQNLLYIADSGNNEIRKLDLSTGNVTSVAGSTSAGFVNGSLASARFNSPYGIAASSDGSKLYVVDTMNNAIRLIDLKAGTVSTIAGGTQGSADGTGTAAQFHHPVGIALDVNGTRLYIADLENHDIRQIDLATANVTTIAGTPTHCGTTDGFGTAASLCSPAQIGYDGHSLYWGDSSIGLVRALNLSTHQVYTMAGAPGVLHMQDGDYTEVPGKLTGPVRYNETFAVAAAPDGSFLLYADKTANVIRIVY